MGQVTGDDLRDLRETLLGTVREGFDRTHARLDLINGRVGRNEVEIGKLQERVKTLFARVFDRRYHERRQDGDEDERAITRRDVAVAVAGGAAILGTIKFLVWVGPALKALAP